MIKWRQFFTFGLRRKVFFTVLLGIVLSISITTSLNSVNLSRELTKSTGEKILLISSKARQIVAEEVENQIGYLKSIATARQVKEIAESMNHNIPVGVMEDQMIMLDASWQNNDPTAEPFIEGLLKKSTSSYLRELQTANPENVEIFITDQFGRNIAMTNRTSDYLQSDEEWWQAAASGKIFTSNPQFDESTNTWALYVSVPIFETGYGGEVIGVVRGTLDLTSIFQSIFNIQFGQTGKGYFLSQEGFLYHLHEGQLLVEQPETEFVEQVQNQNNQWADGVSLQKNNPLIIASNQVGRPGQSLGWIVVTLEEKEIHQLFTETIKKNILITLILAAIIGSLSLLIANNITQALRTLELDARKIAIGDYTLSFSKNIETSSDPHIASLVESFNKMKTAVKSREKAMLASEKKYRLLVESMGEGLAMINQQQKLIFVNPKLCNLLGCDEEELIGQSIEKYFHFSEVDTVMTILSKQKNDLKPSYESVLIKKDGSTLPISISPQHLSNEDGQFTGILAVIMDISDRKHNELILKKRLNELSGLRKIDTAILEKSSLPDVVETVLEQIKIHLNGDAAAIYTYNQLANLFEFSGGYVDSQTVQQAHKIPAEKIFKTYPNFDKEFQIYQNHNNHYGTHKVFPSTMKSLFVAPIMVTENLTGMIEIAFKEMFTLDQEWKSFFDALITQTAVGMEKIDLLNNLKERNQDLVQAYDSAIMGWAKALELRDEETQGHSDRVVKLSLELAKIYGFDGHELDNFRKGALLHDIGKMGIPDTILLKPGPLDAEEWKIMKKHPELAFQLLSGIPFLKDAVEIPYYHHERWDGSGYPHQLQGDQIPLSARIFAVVDVWDALTNDRPYRPAWSLVKTIDYLTTNRGILFDPQIVDQFVQLIQKQHR